MMSNLSAVSADNLYGINEKLHSAFSIVFRTPTNLGDTVAFSLALAPLKTKYPKSFVIIDGHYTFFEGGFMLNPFMAVLGGDPNVDFFIRSPEDLLRLRNIPKIKYFYHIDILMIQLTLLGKWRSGAHEAEFFCDILNLPHPTKLEPCIYLSETEVHQGIQLLLEIGCTGEKPTIILHSEAINLLKRWPTVFWTQLVDMLKEYFFVIQVGVDDCYKIPNVDNYLKSIEVRLLASIAQKAGFFIGVDSGVHHVCRAAGAECIVLAPSVCSPSLWSYSKDICIARDETEFECAYCEQNRFGPHLLHLNGVPIDLDHGQLFCTRPLCLESITPQEVMAKVTNHFLKG